MSRFNEIWEKIIKEADTNGDGEIDFEEFKAAMKKVTMDRATFMKKKSNK